MTAYTPGPGSISGSRPWPQMFLFLLLVWWTFTLGTGISSWCFVDFVNLAFHEAGHLFFGFAGKTIRYLGGTLGQLLVPGLLCGYFLIKERQPFAASVCAWWWGQNLITIAIYMADARSLALPLVGGGDHDWNELFYRFGLLSEPAVHRVSTLTHLLGVLVMILGLVWCGYFLLPGRARERVLEGVRVRWPWLESLLVS